MASLIKEKRRGGISFRVQWVENKTDRKSLRLGSITESAAEEFCIHLEHLIEARSFGRSVNLQTSRYLRRIGDDLHRRLSDQGFIEARTTLDLAGTIRSAIESKPTWKPSTKEKHEITGDHLIGYFGGDCDIRTITSSDAERWREAMLEKLARTTVSKMVKQARFFFKRAVGDNLIEDNPFDGVKAGSEVNSERLRFIDQSAADVCIEAAPNVQWRAIIALARYGGCRTPSETLRIRWEDIHWDKGRFMVRSVKTEHHEGKATRYTPLFPELRTILEEAFD